MKKWIIVILAVLLTVGAGLLVPVLMHSDGNVTIVVEPTGGKVNTIVPAETNVDAGDLVELPDGTSPGTVKSTPGKEIKKTPDTGLNGQSEIGGSSQTPVLGEHRDPVDTDSKGEDVDITEPTSAISESWVEEKIRKHRDEINDEDLEDFRRIYSKVDINFIQGLAKDGYTDEEFEQLKAYLRSTLRGDYERAKELFFNYSYLLNED